MPQPAVTDLAGVADVESLSARAVVELMLERLHPNVALACSFQKEEAVLLDVLLAAEPRARVFALDTHVLFPETYEVWRQIERRYGIEVEVYEGPSLGRQAAVHGDMLWAHNPGLCCAIRKVAPLGRALSGLDGWITGVRRDQSATRAGTPKIGWDDRHELWKASPLADWSDDDVWSYVREHDLPVNPLHERGYASIGCTHCTQPGDGREGRWAGDDKTECGLHGGGSTEPPKSAGGGFAAAGADSGVGSTEPPESAGGGFAAAGADSGVGSTEPPKSAGGGFAAAGAEDVG